MPPTVYQFHVLSRFGRLIGLMQDYGQAIKLAQYWVLDGHGIGAVVYAGDHIVYQVGDWT